MLNTLLYHCMKIQKREEYKQFMNLLDRSSFQRIHHRNLFMEFVRALAFNIKSVTIYLLVNNTKGC